MTSAAITLTADLLSRLGACAEQVAIVRRLYPARVDVSKRGIARLVRAGVTGWGWARVLLAPKAQRAYYAALAEPRRVYAAALAESRQVYDAALAEAGRVCDAAIAEPWRVYYAAKAEAWRVAWDRGNGASDVVRRALAS